MIHRSLPIALRRGRFFLASGLGVTMLASSVLAQVQPGTGQETSAPGTDSQTDRNRRVTTQTEGTGQQAAPDRVIITGSFIPTAEGEGALPVAVFTQDDLRKTGSNSAAEGLRRLPSFVGAATTENDSNAGSGRAGVNLRGLGENNVLILINGHRAGNPSAFSGFTDANAIPFGAIDHIEVLKDGASAQYGSDAVAGVVNYILKTQFEGAQVDFLYGNTTNDDAGTIRADAITGFTTKDKRFNVVLNANYYHANAIYSRDRFLSSIANKVRFGGNDTGSPTFPGAFTVANSAGLGFTGSILQGGTSSNVTLLPPGATLDNGATATVAGGGLRAVIPGNASTSTQSDLFNFRQQTPAIPEQERFAYYGATDYQIIPDNVLDVYAYGLYSNNRQYNGLASSPGSLSGRVGATSPYDPFVGLVPVTAANPTGSAIGPTVNLAGNPTTGTVRYRLLELGPRLSLYDTRYYEGVFGVKGQIKSFGYDLTLSHTEDKQIRTDSGDARPSLLAAATAAGTFNPFRGVNAPLAGTVTFAPGTVRPDGSIRATAETSTYDNTAAVAGASVYGDSVLFNNLNFAEARFNYTFFPDAPQGGFSVALGGEYRRESVDVQPAPFELSGDTFGFNAAAGLHATQDVRSIFGEIRVPIVSPAMNIPGIYNLSVGVAGRYQKFLLNGVDTVAGRGVTPSFETTNPKYEIRYQPIPDITLRGSYSTSFRAPALTDLFTPAVAGANFPELSDPITGTRFQPSLGDTTSGNPNLQPETTDSYTAGLVLSPRFVPGFTITTDYYQINQSNLIVPGASSSQFFVNANSAGFNRGLYNQANGFFDPNAPFANSVIRDPSTGLITSVIEQPFNAAKRSVEGLDVTAHYEFDFKKFFKLDLGTISLTANYNHFFRFNAEAGPQGTGTTNYLGDFSSAPLTPGSIPANKALFQFEYLKDIPAMGIMPKSNFDFVATVNYIGDYVDDRSALYQSTQVLDANGNPPDPANASYSRSRRVREYTTLDLQLSYTIQAPEKVEAVTTTSKDGKDGKRTVSSPGTSPSVISRLLGGTTLTFGCNDVFDTPPPFAAGAFNDNYDTSLYSIRNRFVYGSISKKF